MKVLLGFLASLLVALAAYGALGYVLVHFIKKFW